MTNAAESGRFRIGGAFDVNRLGFGAMRVVGRGVLGSARGSRRSYAHVAAPAGSRR